MAALERTVDADAPPTSATRKLGRREKRGAAALGGAAAGAGLAGAASGARRTGGDGRRGGSVGDDARGRGGAADGDTAEHRDSQAAATARGIARPRRSPRSAAAPRR